MSTTLLFTINVLASLFILYIIFQIVRVRRIMKKCEPVHKRIFRVKGTGKWWRTRIFTIILIIFITFLIFSIMIYGLRSVLLLYISTMVGFTMFSILFQYGKIGKIGISIADTFIPWENIKNCKLEWLPNTNFFYPNGELTLTTYSQQQYVIIVDKKDEKAIGELLEKNNLVAPLSTKK